MWIGLFYSKPTSRFFHFDHTGPTLEKQNPAKVSQCANQCASTPLPDVDVTSKVDKPTSSEPAFDALDLSVKAPEAADDCTVGKNCAPCSEMQSRPEPMRKNKEPAIEPSLNDSPSVVAGSMLMVRSAT